RDRREEADPPSANAVDQPAPAHPAADEQAASGPPRSADTCPRHPAARAETAATVAMPAPRGRHEVDLPAVGADEEAAASTRAEARHAPAPADGAVAVEESRVASSQAGRADAMRARREAPREAAEAAAGHGRRAAGA